MDVCPECGVAHGRSEPHISKARGGRICLQDPADCSHPFGARRDHVVAGELVILCLTCGGYERARPLEAGLPRRLPEELQVPRWTAELVEPGELRQDADGGLLVHGEPGPVPVGLPDRGVAAVEPASPLEEVRVPPVVAEEHEAVAVRAHHDEVHVPGEPAPPVQSLPRQSEAKAPEPDDVAIRVLADIPAYVDHAGRTVLLKQGDIATVSPGVAGLLVRKGKAALLTPVLTATETPT